MPEEFCFSGLRSRLIAQTEIAIACGALQSIPTQAEFIEDQGVRFLVRVVSNLVRKDSASQAPKPKDFNPFLPYEKDLFVADLSDTHICLLNKYNVVEHHLLIVTRAFEEQESLLTFKDFEAHWLALGQIDGLAFYNSGRLAGASQRHKHLQLVPLPLSAQGDRIPVEPLINTSVTVGSVEKIPSFPFVHALAKLGDLENLPPQTAAEKTLACYLNLLQSVNLLSADHQLQGAYNLLATRQWMLIVPRCQESFESISVNSLGFAGALLVRNEAEKQRLQAFGAWNLLKEVAIAT